MTSVYEDLVLITEVETPPEARRVAMRSFAEQLHWTPSYEFTATLGVAGAADHVVVEHGLANSAVISFLRAPLLASDLDRAQLRSLLSISYNNLVEWHIFVSQRDVRRINNLAEPALDPLGDRISLLSPSDFTQQLSAEAVEGLPRFEAVRRTLRSCDDALIQVIGRWKRLLKADYPQADNPSLSTLFNGLIFVRGCEDRRLELVARGDRSLLSILASASADTVDMQALLEEALRRTGVQGELGQYINLGRLAPFRELDKATALNLCRDFYSPRDAAYDFNFALMSKHALSRIYERYVSLLRPDEANDQNQLYFINPTPTEEAPSRTGAVYTPQFIAGFFARYIRDNTTPRRFRALRSLDPACGSGIFLRTLLELQSNPTDPGITKGAIRELFERAEGIDRDENACEATRLSLALLHLVATDNLPERLSIRNAEAVGEAEAGRIPPLSYGAVMTNPPYIKHDFLSAGDRETYRHYLGEGFKGRTDAYLAFIKLCLESLEVDGLACFVLPQAFLNAANAAVLRAEISKSFDVRCLIDLSAVPVFEGVGAYSILLIVQRRPPDTIARLPAQVGQITEFVGAALQACLDGRFVDTPYYKVFPVGQDFFCSKEWIIVSPAFVAIDQALRTMPRLASYARAMQGFVTGADDKFIIDATDVPEGETGAYLPYLPDKSIGRFGLPTSVTQVVFYPYVGDSAIQSEGELQERYPKTWAYLNENKARLEARRRSAGTPWWRPERPRDPEFIRRPKIVCPHLMLTPRFALDRSGQFAVSRSPFIIAREAADEETVLVLLTAILNSSVVSWFIRTNAPKYASGYNRIEIGLLNDVPVPNLSEIDSITLRRVSDLVGNLGAGQTEAEDELESIVMDLYGFGLAERGAFSGAT